MNTYITWFKDTKEVEDVIKKLLKKWWTWKSWDKTKRWWWRLSCTYKFWDYQTFWEWFCISYNDKFFVTSKKNSQWDSKWHRVDWNKFINYNPETIY